MFQSYRSEKKLEHILSKKYIKKISAPEDPVLPDQDLSFFIRDVIQDPAAILMTEAGGVFKTQAVKSIGFNESLPMEEDADFILRFLMKYPRYFAAPGARYFYFEPQANEVLHHIKIGRASCRERV